MKLIDKDTLVAWALEELKLAEKFYKETKSDVYFGKINLLKKQLSFLNTLEVKEVDLEKELNTLDNIYFELNGIAIKGASNYLVVEQLKGIAKHFFELGVQAQKGK